MSRTATVVRIFDFGVDGGAAALTWDASDVSFDASDVTFDQTEE